MLHIAIISSILAGVPYKCTITTAFGFGYFSKAFFSASGSIFHVSLSQSINTGVAFWYIIGFAVAENVSDEQNTISPSFTSRAFNAICIAAVPADSAAPHLTPT